MAKKVVIIGAGPAGLTAAYELLKENKEEYEVIILEAENQVGGISKTIEHNGNRMDIGGHRFFSKNDSVMNFWKELMPIQGENSYDDKLLEREKKLDSNGPDPEKVDKVMLIRDRVSRIYYLKKFFDYPVKLKAETLKNLGIKRTFKAGGSYLKAVLKKREEKSLEDFYINRFGRTLYEMFFEKYTEKLWGIHPSKISPDWGAQRVKGLSILAVVKDIFGKKLGKKKNTETSLIEQFWYPKYGPGQLWETLAEKIENLGGTIKKQCKVIGVNTCKQRVTSIKYMEKEEEKNIEVDYVLSSMPLQELIIAMPEKNKEIEEIAKGLIYRDFITIGLLLDKINLENKTNIKTIGNIVPDCWIYMQEPEVKMCRIQIFNNWSPYMVKNLENRIWIGLEYVCSEKDEIWKMPEEEFKEFAIEELRKTGILSKENKVLDFHIEKVKKAYPAYFGTYDKIEKIKDYINKYENIFCIGRNGQHRYNNMDHSMLTAIEAVKYIKHSRNSKNAIWNVNVEKEYHEEKSKN